MHVCTIDLVTGASRLGIFYRVPNTDAIDAIPDATNRSQKNTLLTHKTFLPWPTSLKLKNAPLARLASIPAPRAPFLPLKAAVITSSTLKSALIARPARAAARAVRFPPEPNFG